MSIKEELECLIGKTIKTAKFSKIQVEGKDGEYYDDEPYLDLEMTDGSKIRIISYYGGYASHSEDEYPRFIAIEQLGV
jgi:hypothetical protein